MEGADQRLKRRNKTGSENREYEIKCIFASLPVGWGYSLPPQSILDVKKQVFTNRASGTDRRRTEKDFQIVRLPLNRFYPHPLPTKHQFFHLGVIAEILVL